MHGDLDLAAIRTFVAVVEDRYFSEAAAALGISQQAISKRIAKLESDLGMRLLSRSRTGAEPTEDGRAFLPYARALVNAADQALSMLRNRRRALRVDVLDTRTAAIDLVQGFYEAVQEADIEIITSDGLRSARETLMRGTIDAAFCRVTATVEGLHRIPAYLEPVHLLVGRDHPLADQRQVEIARLAGSTVWMPGNAAGSEWAEFHSYLGAAFGFHIDTSGPNFGYEHFVTEVATGGRASLVGERSRLPWHPDTVQIPLVDPVPVYPWSLLHHPQNRHPVLRLLTRHITDNHQPFDPRRQWLPEPDRALFTTAPERR